MHGSHAIFRKSFSCMTLASSKTGSGVGPPISNCVAERKRRQIPRSLMPQSAQEPQCRPRGLWSQTLIGPWLREFVAEECTGLFLACPNTRPLDVETVSTRSHWRQIRQFGMSCTMLGRFYLICCRRRSLRQLGRKYSVSIWTTTVDKLSCGLSFGLARKGLSLALVYCRSASSRRTIPPSATP